MPTKFKNILLAGSKKAADLSYCLFSLYVNPLLLVYSNTAYKRIT